MKQRLASGCAADPRLRASRCEVKCSVRRRGPAGCGKHEVMKRGREGGYYSILRLIREGAWIRTLSLACSCVTIWELNASFSCLIWVVTSAEILSTILTGFFLFITRIRPVEDVLRSFTYSSHIVGREIPMCFFLFAKAGPGGQMHASRT